MSTCTKRLGLEFNKLMKREESLKKDGKEAEFRVWLKDGNLKHWGAKIRGPPDTVYAGGIYLLDIKFPDRYPYTPPQIKFDTKMFHPNVSSSSGDICLDILKSGKWSAALRVEKVLLSLISFLVDPNPDDPLYSGAASVYKKDRAEYNKYIEEYKKEYCCKSWEGDN